MKHPRLSMLMVTIIMFNYTAASATLHKNEESIQNQKFNKSLSLGINLANFFPTKSAKERQMKSVLLNPGFEALLNFRSSSDFIISSGLQYQMGKIQRSIPFERVVFDELCVPVIFTLPIANSNSCKFSLSSGFYFGKYMNSNLEIKGGKLNSNNEWIKISKENINGYSNKNSISDLFLGFNFKEFDIHANYLQISLYSRLRLIQHWTNKDVSKIHWGIKISYTLKI